jgi:hypothetical protein
MIVNIEVLDVDIMIKYIVKFRLIASVAVCKYLTNSDRILDFAYSGNVRCRLRSQVDKTVNGNAMNLAIIGVR